MQNDEGKIVDMYIPRKCSATNRILNPKMHSSVQITVGKVDEEGLYVKGEGMTYAISGAMRSKGWSDACMNRLLNRSKVLHLCK
jgi:small subunit ribosomal protein S21e